MKQKLDEPIAGILLTRIALSRSLRIFGRKELARGFQMSIATLDRYCSPSYRELSRFHARRQSKAQTTAIAHAKGTCLQCSYSLKDHARCVECTMLLHDTFQEMCNGCIDSRTHVKMSVQEYYSY